MPASSRPAQRDGVRARLRVIAGSALLLATVLPAAGPLPVVASHTPAPGSVTIAGDLQTEIGCPGDWDPTCPNTHLTYDAADDVWQGTWTIPAGSYQYKAALNDAWDENYGLHGVAGGDNIGCPPRRRGQVLLRPQVALGD